MELEYKRAVDELSRVTLPRDYREALSFRAGDFIHLELLPGPVLELRKGVDGMLMGETGQISLPRKYREPLGLEPKDKCIIAIDTIGKALRLMKAQ